MAITSLLFSVVARSRWNWSLCARAADHGRVPRHRPVAVRGERDQDRYGGWVPIAIAHRRVHADEHVEDGPLPAQPRRCNAGALPLDLFLGDVARRKPLRVPGTAVFMTSSNDGVPVVLLHHLKHNKVLHEQVILMSVVTHEVPEVPAADRVSVEKLEHGLLPGDGAATDSWSRPTCRRSSSMRAISASRPSATTRRSISVESASSWPTARRAPGRGVAPEGIPLPTHVAVAEEALRRHVAQRAVGDRVLRHSAEPRRRAGSAGRVLTRPRRPRRFVADAEDRSFTSDTRLPNMKPRPNPPSAPPTAALVGDPRALERASHLVADLLAVDLDPAARDSRHRRKKHVVAADDRHRSVATRQIAQRGPPSP